MFTVLLIITLVSLSIHIVRVLAAVVEIAANGYPFLALLQLIEIAIVVYVLVILTMLHFNG